MKKGKTKSRKENIKNKRPSAFFISLGCPKNLVDTEYLIGAVFEAGFNITTDPDNADLIVINTCGFISDAINESMDSIEEMIEWKRKNPDVKIIVFGCMVQRVPDIVQLSFPDADAFLGVQDWQGYKAAISKWFPKQGSAMVGAPSRRLLTTIRNSSYIRIADGCDNRCSYCTIYSIRGRLISRPMADIIEEAKGLVGLGVRELNVISQDITSYGMDIGKKNELPILIDNLAKIENLKWIRLLYAHPERLTNELCSAIANNANVCKYLDMPIQHTADKILNNMNRRYTFEDLRKVVDLLRARVPDIVLRTTVIVGFPGESDKDFDLLMKGLEILDFDYAGIFSYSKEEGTPAFEMKDQVPDNIKLERLKVLMNFAEENLSKKLALMSGKSVDTLINLQVEDDLYVGRWSGQAPDIDGVIYVTSKKPIESDFVKVKIDDYLHCNLYGTIENQKV